MLQCWIQWIKQKALCLPGIQSLVGKINTEQGIMSTIAASKEKIQRCFQNIKLEAEEDYKKGKGGPGLGPGNQKLK